MRMRFFLILFLLFGAFFLSPLNSQDLTSAPLNINSWIYWQSVDGLSGHNPYTESSGGFFPVETSGVIYCDGLIWAGLVQDPDVDKPKKRAGGLQYRNGTQPGWIERSGDSQNPPQAISPQDPRARIYRIRTDYKRMNDRELREDAVDLFNLETHLISDAHLDTLRNMYLRDWNSWPGDLGAPYYDNNGNGQWDPKVDEPGLANADQVIWYVVNDCNRERCENLFSSLPIGIELQVTAWAYKEYRHLYGLDGVIYKRYRLINKSGFRIDSMFVGQFSDMDIGDATDDLAGCDSVLNLGYTYDGKRDKPYFGILNPFKVSGGYLLLQGPMVPSPGDKAFYNFEAIHDHKNLKLTSFAYQLPENIIAVPWPGQYFLTQRIYQLLQGYIPDESGNIRWTHLAGPQKGQPTRFPLNGNPVTGEGDVDGTGDNPAPGDRRIYLCSGPFTMQPGETQDIVFAILGAQAPENEDDLLSTQHLKNRAGIYREIFLGLPESIPPVKDPDSEPQEEFPNIRLFLLGQNYPNPFNNTTTLRFRLLSEMEVTLVIYNQLGQKIKTIYKGPGLAQDYSFAWDGTDHQNQALPSGVYYLRLSDGIQTQIRKMVLLR